MNSTHPGNEPDPDDMTSEPDTAAPATPATPDQHDLPDDEADELGNFA